MVSATSRSLLKLDQALKLNRGGWAALGGNMFRVLTPAFPPPFIAYRFGCELLLL